eukprot:1142759-Pelagomonas_calceolata.AAC.9
MPQEMFKASVYRMHNRGCPNRGLLLGRTKGSSCATGPKNQWKQLRHKPKGLMEAAAPQDHKTNRSSYAMIRFGQCHIYMIYGTHNPTFWRKKWEIWYIYVRNWPTLATSKSDANAFKRVKGAGQTTARAEAGFIPV